MGINDTVATPNVEPFEASILKDAADEYVLVDTKKVMDEKLKNKIAVLKDNTIILKDNNIVLQNNNAVLRNEIAVLRDNNADLRKNNAVLKQRQGSGDTILEPDLKSRLPREEPMVRYDEEEREKACKAGPLNLLPSNLVETPYGLGLPEYVDPYHGPSLPSARPLVSISARQLWANRAFFDKMKAFIPAEQRVEFETKISELLNFADISLLFAERLMAQAGKL